MERFFFAIFFQKIILSSMKGVKPSINQSPFFALKAAVLNCGGGEW
jgi:hypothetical protein